MCHLQALNVEMGFLLLIQSSRKPQDPILQLPLFYFVYKIYCLAVSKARVQLL